MSKNTNSKFDFSAFDADPELSKKRHISVPPPTGQIHIEQRPNGFTPMGEIETDRQAYRALTQGRMRWWVIITSWFAIAFPPLIFAFWAIYNSIPVLASGDWGAIFVIVVLLGATLIISSLPLLIVIRATRAKLEHDRQKKTRKWVTNPKRR
ncbi:hypothetical protein LEP3755_45990 [Leptolyngbya sp. NIES-3755]|nr:hypothetical protein LEP3755_45990 [Leptolyngbya sp. NIES-3755]